MWSDAGCDMIPPATTSLRRSAAVPATIGLSNVKQHAAACPNDASSVLHSSNRNTVIWQRVRPHARLDRYCSIFPRLLLAGCSRALGAEKGNEVLPDRKDPERGPPRPARASAREVHREYERREGRTRTSGSAGPQGAKGNEVVRVRRHGPAGRPE